MLGAVRLFRLGTRFAMFGLMTTSLPFGVRPLFGAVVAMAFSAMVAVITVVAAMEFAHLLPGVPLAAGRPSREGHGQSYGPNSRYHAEPVTRFAFEATVST
jgi:hypothetical protein